MPIYEYQCQSCDHELEVIQKISDTPLTTCPECQQDKLKKKVSAAAFRLTGGGWYETDFKSKDKKNLASKESSKPSSESSSSESSSKKTPEKTSKPAESKPAEK